MFYVVYIDILFLVNFFMDFIILTVTGTLLKLHIKVWRRVLGALLGAICYCITLYLPWKSRVWAGNIIIFGSILLIGKLLFSLKGIRKICRFLLLFYATSFFIGGTATTIYYYTKLGYYIRNAVKGDLYAQVLAGVLALIVLISCIFGRMAVSVIRERQKEKSLYFEVELSQGEKKKKAVALLDTGNHLREPVSRKPVILMELAFAGELLDKNTEYAVKEFYKTGMLGRVGETLPKIRLVPYHSIGKTHGILAAVFLEHLSIQMEQEAIELTDVCAALTEEPVSLKGGYQVILNAELVGQL